MTRSHVLLHCKDRNLVAARSGRGKVRTPEGSVGVGRVVEDGTDEESAYARRMDEWVAREGRRAIPREGDG